MTGEQQKKIIHLVRVWFSKRGKTAGNEIVHKIYFGNDWSNMKLSILLTIFYKKELIMNKNEEFIKMYQNCLSSNKNFNKTRL